MLRSVKCLQKSSKLDHAGCSSLARDLNLEAGDKWIGRKKNAHISWYPGPNHEFLSPNELLESILQPGLVHLDGHVFTPRILQCAARALILTIVFEYKEAEDVDENPKFTRK